MYECLKQNQYDKSLQKLKWSILVRGDMRNKYFIGDTWSPTSSMSSLKYFVAYAVKKQARLHQLDFIGALLKAKLIIGYL